MAYADNQGMSRNRMMALGGVALLHVILGYALITGLALKVVKAIVNPLEAVDIKEEAPPPEEPPPPPPKDIEIPPYVPPPEVSVQSDAPPPPTISTSSVPQTAPPVFTPPAPPAAPPAPPPPAPPTNPTDRGRGNTIGPDDYPDASRRAEETGVVRITITVAPDGRVSQCAVTASSGFPRLDEATCRVVQRRWRYNPGTRDGKPVDATVSKKVTWKLEDAR
ncbi:hypothetical protein IP88_05355 [alpha proteobacterium AAP81b]|nr:hypothetical protein IP88_05355 [alpha proteobacterium AAP81b]